MLGGAVYAGVRVKTLKTEPGRCGREHAARAQCRTWGFAAEPLQLPAAMSCALCPPFSATLGTSLLPLDQHPPASLTCLTQVTCGSP